MYLPVVLRDNGFGRSAYHESGVGVSASSAAAGFAASNLTDGFTHTSWKAGSAGSAWIKSAGQTCDAINALGLYGHNLYSIAYKVKVQRSLSDVESWSDWTDWYTPTSDGILLLRFPESLGDLYDDWGNPNQYKWIYKVLLEPTGANGTPQITSATMGTLFEFPWPADTPYSFLDDSPVPLFPRVSKGAIMSVGRRYRNTRISVSWSDLPKDWVEDTFIPFFRILKSTARPFFWCADLERTPDEVYYMRIAEDAAQKGTLSTISYVDRVELDMVGVLS